LETPFLICGIFELNLTSSQTGMPNELWEFVKGLFEMLITNIKSDLKKEKFSEGSASNSIDLTRLMNFLDVDSFESME
jgi:hypothetical protein